MAASEAAKEGIYLRNFAAELDKTLINGPTPIRADNKAAIDLAYNPDHHQRTKHINRRHFFIRECVENMELSVPFVGTLDNRADFFTKALPDPAFRNFRETLMGFHSSR